ncbi:MAG: FG-GAP-like repeat-containing protein, partial [Bacteroidota bacterium]
GLGDATEADVVTVSWPDGSTEHRTRVRAAQKLVFDYENATPSPPAASAAPPQFAKLSVGGLDTLRHHENPFNDYQTEPLIPYQYSRLGPFIASGDANEDGRDDLFIGSAYGQAPRLLLQQLDGSFREQAGPWNTETEREEGGVRFLDADGDGDLDLYLARGGNEFFRRPAFLQDQLFVNLGNGNFTPAILPTITAATGAIAPADYDGDGDLDLFIAGRNVPGEYPMPARSYLLRNDGGQDANVRYTDVTEAEASELLEAGMITAATWADLDADGSLELLLAGEWQPVRIFDVLDEGLRDQTKAFGLKSGVGWFQSLATADLDGDGDQDIIAGNLGRNYKYHASPEAPFTVHSGDFDQNGRRDIVLGYHQQGEHYPLRGRQCSAEQIPALEIKFRSYESFANADLEEVYGTKNLENALSYEATEFASLVLMNEGAAGFRAVPLPPEAQLSSVNGILIDDYSGDGHPDVLIAGNLYRAEVETPRNDASIGLLLVNDGKGNLREVPVDESGVFLPGDVKSLIALTRADDQLIIAGRNDATLATLRFTAKSTVK